MSAAPETTAEKRQPLAAASNPKPAPSVPGCHGHPALHPEHGHHTTPAPQYAPPNQGLYEWTARIECEKFELGCSYSVIIFLGPVPDDPNEWQVSPNFVGAHHAYVSSTPEEYPRDKVDVVIEGFVHLNQAIVRHSGLKSLEPDLVVPYLTKTLHWGVLKVECEPVKLKSLEVTVLATPLSYPPGAIFPVPGKPHRYDSITYGREGGSRHTPH